ncbi:MAG TPA: hypothetical protein GXX38_06025 [Clostridia bacterium]|nr:hypothetical protein [Clostridia bacterium]
MPQVGFKHIRSELEEKMDRRKTRAKRKLKRKRILLIICFVLLGNYLYSYLSLHFKQLAIEKEINAVQLRIEQKKKEIEEIRKEIEWLNSDEYIEQAAREELGMVKPGETVLYFDEKDESN